MKVTRSTVGVLSLLWLVIATSKVSSDAASPENILLEILLKPFKPSVSASHNCIHASSFYLEALKNYEPWAFKMYDASDKIASGIITGNHAQLGNFDECLGVSTEHFSGQACIMGVQFHKNDNSSCRFQQFLNSVANASDIKWTSESTVVYEWTLCVPSTCQYSDIRKTIKKAFAPLINPGCIDLSVQVRSCQTQESIRVTWDVADIIYTALIVLFALICVANTGYDIARSKGWITSQETANHEWKKDALFTSFSWYTNGKALMQTDRPKGYLNCLDGLRTLTICWIIYGHTYYTEATSVKLNLADIPRMHLDWTNMLALNGNIATDIFFLMSGTVNIYNELLKKERFPNQNLKIIRLWCRRYLRLTPAYAMMIGFYATLFYKLGNGPHWDRLVGTNKEYCRENWWLNLIYMNNYFHLDKVCMSQSWYLSVDMQLAWFSPLILYPMYKKECYFIVTLVVCLLLSIVIPFTITYTFALPGTMLYYKKQTDLANVFVQIYSTVWCRFGTYTMGLGLGYILYKTRVGVKMSKWTLFGGWLIATTFGLSAFFGPREFYFDDHIYNALEASFYAGLHRQVFVLSIVWIIFCCMHNYAGIVNDFLSWRGWVPLSKLTYCAYLCHFVVLLSKSGSVRTVGNLTTMDVMYSFVATVFFTFVMSVLWYLCFEKPCLNIEKLIYDYKPNQIKATRSKSDVDMKNNEEDAEKTCESSTTSSRQDNRENPRETENGTIFLINRSLTCKSDNGEQARFNYFYFDSFERKESIYRIPTERQLKNF